jgi:hypothetical protein
VAGDFFGNSNVDASLIALRPDQVNPQLDKDLEAARKKGRASTILTGMNDPFAISQTQGGNSAKKSLLGLL